MAQATLSEIVGWSKGQPAWQRDALRRLMVVGPLSEADLDELTDICKAQHGLIPAMFSVPLSDEHVSATPPQSEPVSLTRLTHVIGVNALGKGQTVAFGPQLTVVFGQNAAGKSGYTRILKGACRSRFREAVLGNVLATGAPPKAQARIGYKLGSGSEEFSDWTPDGVPSDLLAAISVFDSNCAPVYLRDKTDVAFRPFGLDVFDRLASACASVKKRLEIAVAAISTITIGLPTIEVGTDAGALLASLNALTKESAVTAMATLSENENGQLALLRQKQLDLLVTNPKQRADELFQKSARLESLRTQLASAYEVLDNAGVSKVNTALERVRVARSELEALQAATITADLLTGTGGKTWRALWESAAAFSAVAYSNTTFPATGKIRCVLCQQFLDDAASDRLDHFGDFFKSKAQDELRNAEDALNAISTMVNDLVSLSDNTELVLAELAETDKPRHTLVSNFINSANEIRTACANALASDGVVSLAGLAIAVDAELSTEVEALRGRAADMRKGASTLSTADSTTLKNLEARRTPFMPL